MHSDQLDVPLAIVRQLVDEQFPRWSRLPLEPVAAAGTVNALFRLGGHLGARLPLRPAEIHTVRTQLESEATAARELLGRTRFRTPEPVALGEPGAGYPLPWSIQTWLPGTAATMDDPGTSVGFARDLAEFIRGVRAIDTGERTFSGSGRGGNLRDHDEWMRTCLRRSARLLDVPRLRRAWAWFRGLPPTGSGDLMTHGDLIPGNVLVSGGRLAAVIDVGGLGPADPALDLVAAWHLLDDEPRRHFRDELGCGDLEWERGKAWAFQQSMGAGARTLDRILANASI